MLEENLHMYEIIGYFFGFGLLTGIRKSIHSIVATLAVYIKYVSFFFFFFLQNSPILWVNVVVYYTFLPVTFLLTHTILSFMKN